MSPPDLKTSKNHYMYKKLPHQKRPCKNCPFLNNDDTKSWLGEKRANEICEAASFVCHKNNDLQCAGHMILMDDSNLFIRLSNHYKIDLDLRGQDNVFKSKEQMIKHHSWTN